MRSLFASVLALALLAPPRADACRLLEVDFTPTPDLQIVVWLEDADGNFVDTLFITRKTGTYGIGNRPGIMEFNSEFLWPYGRRETVFPVWANRHPYEYPALIFQDEDDPDLSHPISMSSSEPYFCRPLIGLPNPEEEWYQAVDAGTCATSTFTDKGKFVRAWDGGGPIVEWSKYPPRNDYSYDGDPADHPDVAEFAALNNLDAISQATPIGGMPYTVHYLMPADVVTGDYVLWVEVSKEFDQNGTYAYPSPTVAWGNYGRAYRGQPSVVYRLPFSVDDPSSIVLATEYEGYGDPDGITGMVFSPDGTITENVEGSGAGRLLLSTSPEGTYRVRLGSFPSNDIFEPEIPLSLEAIDVQATEATFSFIEPNDNTGDVMGPPIGYEARYMAGRPITEENFLDGVPIDAPLVPTAAGATITFPLENLSPETIYYVGVRAHDRCLNWSPLAVASVTTPKLAGGEVSACFVATAAYGSAMEKDVSTLRSFRDRALRSTVLGEIFVEAYYAFGPALAETIRPSQILRSFVRTALGPLVGLARNVVE